MSNKQETPLPLFVLGAQKAGTTTMFDLMSGTRGLIPANVKEVGFFSKDCFYQLGEDWYLSNFDLSTPGYIFEATPEYLYYPFVPDRIYNFNPESKFIVIFRDPACRAYAAWNMFRRFNKDPSLARMIYGQFTKYANASCRDAVAGLLFSSAYPSFAEVVEDDIRRCIEKSEELEPSFVRRGLYEMQISEYLKYFRLEQFLFLEQAELGHVQVLSDRLSNFLGYPVCLSGSKLASNVGEYSFVTLEDERALTQLRAFYHPYNIRLFQLLGVRFDWGE